MVTVVRIQLQPFLHEHLECRTIETSPTVQMNCLITLVCSLLTFLLPEIHNLR